VYQRERGNKLHKEEAPILVFITLRVGKKHIREAVVIVVPFEDGG
jgi:hypothetical protein